MISGKTSKGFEFELEDDVLDNWEILEMIQEVDSGNAQVMTRLAPALLGPEQTKRLKDFVRQPNGVVRITDMSNALADIFASCNQLKK